MTRDASLDEFLGGEDSGAESEDAADEEGKSEGESIDDEGVGEIESVSPVEATYMWTPAGDACARCESDAGRLWRCDGELVCGECKEW